MLALYESKLFYALRYHLDEVPRDIQSIMDELAERATSFFDDAESVSDSFFTSVDDASTTSVLTAMQGFKDKNKYAIAGGLDLSDSMKKAVQANTALIKSISSDYHDQISGVVQDAFEKGSGYKTIFDRLKGYDGVTERRANFIARDQTSKFFADLTSTRASSAGVKQFRWLHSSGSAYPREYHMNVLNGKIFSYDDLPVIDLRTGQRGLPGSIYNCGCQQIIIDPDA